MWVAVLLVCLSLFSIYLLVQTARKRDWGQALQAVVAVVLFICSSVPLGVLVVNHQIILEIRAPEGEPPQLEITEVLPPRNPDENTVDLYVRIANRGTGFAEKCTAEAKIVGTVDKYHLWMSETINPGDWGEVWVARAVREDGVWKTWLVTPQLAEAIGKGGVVNRIPWAKPVSWGSYQLELTIYAQTQSPLRVLELNAQKESQPTLRLTE